VVWLPIYGVGEGDEGKDEHIFSSKGKDTLAGLVGLLVAYR
jgi:hypothetical protein